MKKLLTILVMSMALVASTSARETVEGSKLTDNLSLGVAGGVVTSSTHGAFFGNMRPIVNLTLGKQITPILGLALEGTAAMNPSCRVTHAPYSSTVFDFTNVSLLGQFNLTNLFKGYKGSPRPFELVAVYGAGWGHLYINKTNGSDQNFATSKAGLNFNFNIGKAKAWQINVKPAIVWNIDGMDFDKYNMNRSALELTAGITYKFRNSNGTHNFKLARLYDQGEVDGLNAKINDLRGSVNNLNAQINAKDQVIKELQNQLNDSRNKAPQIVKETTTLTSQKMESVVTFAQGKSVIAASQYPNVERIATYLKNHKDARVIVKGYASPEGSIEINEKLAKERAEAVKKMLVNKYRIAASRIDASGQGIGNMFSEPDWNRVSIATIEL